MTLSITIANATLSIKIKNAILSITLCRMLLMLSVRLKPILLSVIMLNAIIKGKFGIMHNNRTAHNRHLFDKITN